MAGITSHLGRWWPKTLYARTSAILAVTTLLFLLLTLATIGYLIVVPVAKRSADDLAALMMVSAQTWVELPPRTRPDFEHELKTNHGLVLSTNAFPDTDDATILLPYFRFLKEALTQRSGEPVSIHPALADDGSLWYRVDIPVHERTVRIAFTLTRLGPKPPLAALIIFVLGITLVLFTALILVRRLIKPLAYFSRAADKVGRGVTPDPLPESGPAELRLFARTFNHMALQVRELLDDRTTMLSGIAHDLRTPLARLRLTVEMLKGHADGQSITEATQDLDEMTHLINQYLELGRILTEDSPETIDIRDIIDHCVIDARRMGARVDWTPDAPCVINLQPLVLTRILSNLLQNAVLHGAGQGITVEYRQVSGHCLIMVRDRGPGIPETELEAVFRPFYRLDRSRNNQTGGSGLGLAISRQLAQFHGWTLTLSTPREGGTEARVAIPHPTPPT